MATRRSAKGDVKAQVDEEHAKGFVGDKVDPLPNEHYAFPGPGRNEPAEAEDGEPNA